jgi:hypothetical protein
MPEPRWTLAAIQKYLDWIEAEYGDKSDAWMSCMCTPISLRMKRQFPELLLMSGDAVTADNVYEHTWLQTEDGLIIDPTERQFPTEVEEYHATLADSTDPEQRSHIEACLTPPSNASRDA